MNRTLAGGTDIMSGGKYQDLLRSRGFLSFLTTQFLGALNDNVYKIVVALIAVNVGLTTGAGGAYLSLAGAVFVLPFLLFSGYAGYFADTFNKRTVLIVTKSFEVVAMGLAFLAFLSGRIELMLFVLFLMALQSTFFSPAKYGILPEMFPDKDLTRANGLLETSTFLAIIFGTSIGGVLFTLWKDKPEWIGLVLIGIAVAGTLASLGISRVPSSGAQKPFRMSPWAEIASGIVRLYREKVLWMTVMGLIYFWFLGALLQMVVILFGKEVMGLGDLRVGLLGAFIAVGIGVGSLAAGRLSGDKVELGLVPFGSIGMGAAGILLFASSDSYVQVVAALVFLGFSGGLFIVPLNAFLQQRAGREEKGRLIATSNFLNMGGVLLASGLLWLLHDSFRIQADQIILIFSLLTLAATVYILTILPDFLIRFTLWLLTHTFYRIRIVGQQHVPARGPALLVCNHLSYIDPMLVGACVQRFIRFIAYREFYQTKGLYWLMRRMKAIPIDGRSKRDVLEAIERARDELRQGHVVCIFAEGAISRTGNLLPFKRGFERIMAGLDVPIIPVHLDQVWGSIFSFKDGRIFWKRPRQLPYPVTVSFGQPMPSTAESWEVRQAVLELGSEAVRYRRTPRDLLHLRFLRTAKRRWFSFCMADSTRKDMTYGQAVVGSLALARWLRKHRPTDQMVGVLLPASVAGVLVNVAVLLAGKVPVNLNFTMGREGVASAIDQCDIKTIFTARRFLAKVKLEGMEGLVFVEEVTKQITTFQKALTALFAFLLPAALLRVIYSKDQHDPDGLATVMFSSGSTGVPKGVMLSHHNILSNVEAINQILQTTKHDRMMGVLPFFHTFGFTGTLWLPLITGIGAVYHAPPMDSRTIGEMIAAYQTTVLISTPTFYKAYLRVCSPEQFSSLRFPIVGAEKLPEPLATAFKEKYGLDLLEGYGCTELGPAVSINLPDVADRTVRQTGLKVGTVGHPIPGVTVKVINPETGEPLPAGQEGLLLVKSPARMLGYLGAPEKTSEVLRNGWYVTGDIASLDEDGFIRITDRLSRFSKIAGEMVPHIRVEETINHILGGDHGCIVTSIPDEERGERLAVLYTHDHVVPEALWEKLSQTGLPKLWTPKRENLYLVAALPTLGTGKADLGTARRMAMERAGGRGP